jgi:lipopolysaccharide export LptBFGC system permease protein LptF
MRILHRYILREMSKAFGLGLAAITGVLCLGLVLKELQDKGLGPVTSVVYMLLAIPFATYLALALAAVLATTVVYGRLTADREIQACRASGIPLASLLWPAVVLAVGMALASLALAAWPLPEGHYAMKRLALADVERVFFAELADKNVKVRREGFQLTVDRVDGDVLYGPTLTRRRGDQETYVYAPIGKVQFDHARNQVNLTLWDSLIIRESGETPVRGTHKVSLELPSEVPRAIGERTLWELMAAQHYPAQFSNILSDPQQSKDLTAQEVQREKNKVRAAAMAAFHGRLATAVGCLGLVILGAVLGIVFHSGHLLTAFIIAAVPGIGASLATMAGMQVVESHVEQAENWLYLVWLPNMAMVVLAAGAVAYLLWVWARPNRLLRFRRHRST